MDPSDHRLNTHLVSGPPCGEPVVMLQVEPAIQETAAGAVYVPAGQPAPETLKAAATLLSISTPTRPKVKCAVIVLGPFMITVNGFAVPVTDPLQLAN